MCFSSDDKFQTKISLSFKRENLNCEQKVVKMNSTVRLINNTPGPGLFSFAHLLDYIIMSCVTTPH